MVVVALVVMDYNAQAMSDQTLRCSRDQLMLMTRQFACLMSSGVGVARALQTLAETEAEPGLKQALTQIHADICRGQYLSRACARLPGIFSPVYVAMIETGESSGRLNDLLHRMACWLERESDLLKRLRSALIYPLTVLTLSLLMLVVVFLTVIPGFLQVLIDARVPLPWMTRLTFALAAAVASPAAWLLAGCLLLLLAAFVRERLASEAGREQLYSLALSVPGLRELLTYAAASRFASAMAVLLNAGVDLLKSLRLAARVSGSPALVRELEDVVQAVKDGQVLSQRLAESPHCPAMLAQLVAVGEQSAKLAEMFSRGGEFYTLEVHHRVESLMALLEPVMLAGLSLFVGFTAVSLMLPLYRMVSSIA
ncbi:MAG: hypothetical protein AMXMBFR33_61870 [Candidatus Xenobia bacterium]